MKRIICPFCKKEAQWCENKEIYGKNYGKSYMCWLCKECNAYVGCHNNSKKPLGTMANEELRYWRIEAHRHIDLLWKRKGWYRGDVYNYLRKKLKRNIHIGESDIKTCQEILKVEFNNKNYEKK